MTSGTLPAGKRRNPWAAFPTARRLLRQGLRGSSCAAVLLLVHAAGCGDEPLVQPCPPADGIVVQGYVRDTEIVPSIVQADGAGSIFWRTRIAVSTDEEGFYRLVLPVGDYLLSATPSEPENTSTQRMYAGANGLTPDFRAADTLRVTGQSHTRRIDFLGGALDVAMDFPGDLPRPFLESLVLRTESGRGVGDMSVALGTARNGRFRLLPPGDLVVLIRGSAGQIWIPASYSIDGAERIEIRTGEISTLTVPSFEVGWVRGAVTGSWQQTGLSPPLVDAYLQDSGGALQVRAESDGSFAIPFFASAEIRVRYTIGSTERWVGGTSQQDASVFQAGPGMDLELPPLEEHGLRVAFDFEGSPEAVSAEIEVVDLSGRVVARGSPRGSEDGVVSGLDPGFYRVHIRASGSWSSTWWTDQWYDRRTDAEAADVVEIAGDGSIPSITVVLQRGAVLSGRLTTPSGAPVRTDVVLEDAALESSVRGTFSDAGTGDFVLRGAADGRYRIRAYGHPFWVYYPGVLDPDSATIVTVIGREDIPNLDWTVVE